MNSWSLSTLLDSLHHDLESRLALSRASFGHPGSKGDASESAWLTLLEQYLPKRYQAANAHVVDSKGSFSDQIDVVIFDRQYTPFIFNFGGQLIVPAEGVYAVFETKQAVNADVMEYARRKAASVRRLHRTSIPIPFAGGVYPAKQPPPILAGILALESDWSPAMGASFTRALDAATQDELLDVGCIAAHGIFALDEASQSFKIDCNVKPAAAFLFSLISRLQKCATVPMIDIEAYGAWLGTPLRS